MQRDRVEDRAAIQELKARYCRYLDTKEWARYRELLTDDLVFYLDRTPVPSSTTPISVGADEYVARVSQKLAHAITVHQAHMSELTFTDERSASGVWAMFDWVDSSDSEGWSFRGFGHYHEQYILGVEGSWRIAELRLTRLRFDTTGTMSGWPNA